MLVQIACIRVYATKLLNILAETAIFANEFDLLLIINEM